MYDGSNMTWNMYSLDIIRLVGWEIGIPSSWIEIIQSTGYPQTNQPIGELLGALNTAQMGRETWVVHQQRDWIWMIWGNNMQISFKKNAGFGQEELGPSKNEALS